jgi:hypothetical protein
MPHTSRLAALELERDEWRKRAESAARPQTRTEYVVKRAPLGARLLAALWLLVLGLLVGGAALPHANDAPVLREDYETCISSAKSQAPPHGDAYGNLVDALYVCGVYDGGVASG